MKFNDKVNCYSTYRLAYPTCVRVPLRHFHLIRRRQRWRQRRMLYLMENEIRFNFFYFINLTHTHSPSSSSRCPFPSVTALKDRCIRWPAQKRQLHAEYKEAYCPVPCGFFSFNALLAHSWQLVCGSLICKHVFCTTQCHHTTTDSYSSSCVYIICVPEWCSMYSENCD